RPDGNSKKGPTIDEGISQSLRNQRHDEIPLLFAYSQLLLSVNGNDGRYGTCGTPRKFWAAWREEDLSDAEMYAIKNRTLSEAELGRLFDYRPAADRRWYDNLVAAGHLAVTGQDRLLIRLLRPTRRVGRRRFCPLCRKRAGQITA